MSCEKALSRLHQIQIRYAPQEDRILLRIKTADRLEFRFWLTRRYVKLLWPMMLKMLSNDQRVRLQADAESRRAVLAFQHEKAVSQSDFSTAFKEDAETLPLGESPVLLAKIQLKQQKSGGNVLCMHPRSGKGVELAMDETLLHSFSKLLAEAVSTSGWDIALKLPADTGQSADAPERIN